VTGIDPAAVMAAHKPHRPRPASAPEDRRCVVCRAQFGWATWPCEPYRLAEALAASERALDYSNKAREIMRAEKEHGWREAEKWEVSAGTAREALAAARALLNEIERNRS
jgi:hypothetical protein